MSDDDISSVLSIFKDRLSAPRPDEQSIPAEKRDEYIKRSNALRSVWNGMSVHAAASFHSVNRNTLRHVVELAEQVHPDGHLWAFRACIPHIKKLSGKTKQAAIPLVAGPHAMDQLLTALPDHKSYVDKYTGPLPTRQQSSPKFDRFFDEFVRRLKRVNLEHAYPLNCKDKGRRALRIYINRQRTQLMDAGGGSGADEIPSLTRLDQIFVLKPLERVEMDAHRIDIDGYMYERNAKGEIFLRPVKTIWILAMIDVASRVILAWMLHYADSYKRFTLLRLLAKALRPWRRRELVSPQMAYGPGAWMPSEHCPVPRTIGLAYDNAKAHHADIVADNTIRYQLGFIHAGPSHSPQVRAYIEAFFKTIETQILRHIAGGFEPARSRNDEPKKVSPKNAKDHPIDPDALYDLLDIAICTYHTIGHSDLQDRSPRQVFEHHIDSGGWFFASSLTDDDAKKLAEIRINVTIRGYKRDGKPPEVRWKGARYRSPALMHRWDLVGSNYVAVIRFEDARKMRLYDPSTGQLFVTLEALPPWHSTPHTIEDRERALVYLAKSGALKDGVVDAIAAYHQYTFELAAGRKANANSGVATNTEVVRNSRPNEPIAQDPNTYTPATGWVSFQRKRSPR